MAIKVTIAFNDIIGVFDPVLTYFIKKIYAELNKLQDEQPRLNYSYPIGM